MAMESPDGHLLGRVKERLASRSRPDATTAKEQARADHRRLAEEQAALRRVATLVAEGAAPAEVFAAVAREVAVVLDLPATLMCRYEPDGTATILGSRGRHPFTPGTTWVLDGPTLMALVRETARPARVDDYTGMPGTVGRAAGRAGFEAGAGAPIVVDGSLWGAVCAVADGSRPLPADAESRLNAFTELVATAISNAEARAEVHRLADEQAALRRVATLVARGASPARVFGAVAEEVGRLLHVDDTLLVRFEEDGTVTLVASWGKLTDVRGFNGPPVDGGLVATLRRTGRPFRDGGDRGARAVVGAPIAVQGRLWGAMVVLSLQESPLPADAESRIEEFTELVATAIANVEARSALAASRSRIAQEADEQRRRVVRDLHDGAQSYLVHAVIALEHAKSRLAVTQDGRSFVDDGLVHVRCAIAELRELSHGIHPSILTNRGLAAAVEVLAESAPLPVHVAIPEERYPPAVESAAYFVTAEALTNVAKYARASRARVTASRTARSLTLVVEDDGTGGAERAPGSGLAGLADRLAALDGALAIDSPPGAGTRITAEIPLGAPA
jgi:signal transduction histidine kinase